MQQSKTCRLELMTTNNKEVHLIADKVGMTQMFDDNGRLIPVTVLKVQETKVLQIKTIKNDGYNAVQAGYGEQKPHRVSNAVKGHCKKANVEKPVEGIYEFRTDEAEQFNPGEILAITNFEAGQKVDISGVSKGKGFQGVVKRYGFDGGPASHGSMSHRRGGSYGNCQTPGHVIKGKKMPGHMGAVSRTSQNMQIVKIFEDQGLIVIKGSIPGYNGSTVRIRKTKKSRK